MKIFFLLFFALLIIILLLLLFTRINLSFNAEKKQGERLKTYFEVSFFRGFIKIKKSAKPKKIAKKGHMFKNNDCSQEEDTSFIKKVKEGYKTFCAFKYAYKKNSGKLRKAIYAKKINLHINYGSGNAASTGIITGAICAAVFNVISFVSSLITIAEPKINIIPNYNEKQCSAKCECIITSRLVNLIGAALSIAISYFAFKRKEKIKKQK